MDINQSIRNNIYLGKKIIEYFLYLRPFTQKNRHKNNLENNSNISIFSEPRGGSTWLAELLCKIPDSTLVSEPLFLIPTYKELKAVNFCFNQYIPEEAEWPEAEDFFRKLYNREVGSLGALRLYYHNRTLANIKNSKYFIYKDVNSSMMLPWITRKFDINPIYIIRHPCAVVASQLQYRHWDYIQSDVKAYFPNLSCRFKEIYDQYEDVINKISQPEERLAAEWALHNILPISHPQNNKKWITVSYEKIYKEPEVELNNIFSRLNIEIPKNLLSHVSKPSNSSILGSESRIRSGGQLTGWQKVLSKTQIRNILAITNEFGINFYYESPEPDYSKIYT